MAAKARARNQGEKPVKAAVKTAPAEMAAVQVLTAVERAEKPLCRAQSFLSDSRGTVSSADWLFPCSTMQQPVLSTERCKTRSHQKLCYVQAEPHLKSGTITVGELGPEKLGNLNPGQEATSSLPVASEPELAGVSYDGYVVHMEVFDCSGPGPAAHSGGEGAEGSGERVSGGEEGSGANALAPDETFDEVRSGARLILSYDAASNSFKGTVENVTNGVLDRVRIEVHLSNGAELGPTTPMNMAPGQVVMINQSATTASFTGWTPHAEVGAGGEGSESGEEHRNGGEHGGGRESGGEHGSGGEQRRGD